MQYLIDTVNLALRKNIPYKMHIETLVENKLFCVVIRNSLHEGYFDTPICKNELLKICNDSKQDIQLLFKNLRQYAKKF